VKAIEAMIQSAHKPAHGVIGSIIGVFALFLGASGVFCEIQDALNSIWHVNPDRETGIRWRRNWAANLQARSVRHFGDERDARRDASLPALRFNSIGAAVKNRRKSRGRAAASAAHSGAYGTLRIQRPSSHSKATATESCTCATAQFFRAKPVTRMCSRGSMRGRSLVFRSR
jgi:hypothetical protein